MKKLILFQWVTLTPIKPMIFSERWPRKHHIDLNLVSHQKLLKTTWLWRENNSEHWIFHNIFKMFQLDLLKNGFRLMIRMNSLNESTLLLENSIPLSQVKKPQIRHIQTSSRGEKLIQYQESTRWLKMQRKYLEQHQWTILVKPKSDLCKCMSIWLLC
jgi:hypothetical protein